MKTSKELRKEIKNAKNNAGKLLTILLSLTADELERQEDLAAPPIVLMEAKRPERVPEPEIVNDHRPKNVPDRRRSGLGGSTSSGNLT